MQLGERLEKLAHHEALLVLCKTSFPPDWQQAYCYPLVSGPSRYMRIYYKTPPPEPRLAGQSRWLDEFQCLRRLAQSGGDFTAPASRLRQEILDQLAWEEVEMFPRISQFLGSDRPTREMGYEHQGLRHFLPGLELALSQLGRTWERFSLDLIHLLEHHIEHEESGLYRVYDRLG